MPTAAVLLLTGPCRKDSVALGADHLLQTGRQHHPERLASLETGSSILGRCVQRALLLLSARGTAGWNLSQLQGWNSLQGLWQMKACSA